MSRNRFYIAIAILVVMFSVLAFILPFQHSAVFWVAYIFGIIAICLQMITIPESLLNGRSARSRFYGFPVARVSLLYLGVQIVMSFVFMALSGLAHYWIVRIEVTVFIIMLMIAVIGFFSADAVKKEIERQDDSLRKDVSTMRTLQSQMVSLVNQCSDAATKEELEKLSDAFRFSDPVSNDATLQIEADLLSMVNDMQSAMLDADYAGIIVLCEKTSPVLARRNQICKQNKQLIH